MGITPGMWALIGCVVVLTALHAGVYLTVAKLKKRIQDLEDKQK
jgi:hypothetical protein